MCDMSRGTQTGYWLAYFFLVLMKIIPSRLLINNYLSYFGSGIVESLLPFHLLYFL